MNNEKIISWFIDNKLTPAKSLTVEAPSIPKEYIKDFLRGVIDGDGSIMFKKSVRNNSKRKYLGISIVSASKIFADQLCFFIKELGTHCNLYVLDNAVNYNRSIGGREINSKNILYRVYMGSSDSVKLCKIMYSGNHICLKRKYEKYLKYLSAREEEKKDISKIFKMKYLSKEEMLNNVKNLSVSEYAKELGVTNKGLLKKLHKLGIYIKSL